MGQADFVDRSECRSSEGDYGNAAKAGGEHKLVNPNLLQMDEPRDIQDFPMQVSIRCPHCMQIGVFPNVLGGTQNYTKYTETANNPDARFANHYHASLRVCPNEECLGLVIVIQRDAQVMQVLPSEKLEFVPDGIPAKLVATLKEAVACHSAEAYRASAMMVRRLMGELCEDNGASGSNST